MADMPELKRRVKFSGQARHVVDQRPGEFSELDDFHRKLVNHFLYSGTYRIPRDTIVLMDQATIDRMHRYMTRYASTHNMSTSIETDFKTGDCIVKWWPTDGEMP